MDVTYQIQGQLFEWDAEKAAVNLRKHGISFERSCEVFFDPFIFLVDALAWVKPRSGHRME
jgi:uncharacterized DUF497 family protein